MAERSGTGSAGRGPAQANAIPERITRIPNIKTRVQGMVRSSPVISCSCQVSRSSAVQTRGSSREVFRTTPHLEPSVLRGLPARQRSRRGENHEPGFPAYGRESPDSQQILAIGKALLPAFPSVTGTPPGCPSFRQQIAPYPLSFVQSVEQISSNSSRLSP